MSIILQIWYNFYVISFKLWLRKNKTLEGYLKIHGPERRFRHIQEYSGMFRHIQTYPDVIGHIQVKLGVIQAYFEPYVTLAYLQNSGRFRILAYSKPETYSEPWYIQNSGTFRTRDIFKILDYSEPWDIQNRRHTHNLIKHLR